MKLFLAVSITVSAVSPILAACAPHLVLRDQTGAMLICSLAGETSDGICIYECGAATPQS